MSDTLTFLGLTEKLIRQEKRPLSPAGMWANPQATLNKMTMNKDVRAAHAHQKRPSNQGVHRGEIRQGSRPERPFSAHQEEELGCKLTWRVQSNVTPRVGKSWLRRS
jgi:hypothetical protein